MEMVSKDHALKMIALAIGTSRDHKDVEDHYLWYLMNKFNGDDGLALDQNNYATFERLREMTKNKKVI